MELRSTEQQINDLLVAYEGIRRSPFLRPDQQALLPPTPDDLAPSTAAKSKPSPVGTASSRARAAATNKTPTASSTTTTTTSSASASSESSLVQSLASTEEALAELLPRVEKFRKRLFEIDPVTEKPRYGPQNRERVRLLARRYDFLGVLHTVHFPEVEKEQWLRSRDYQTKQSRLRDERQDERRREFAKQKEKREQELLERQRQQQQQQQQEKEKQDGGEEQNEQEQEQEQPPASATSSSSSSSSIIDDDSNRNPDGSLRIDPENDVLSGNGNGNCNGNGDDDEDANPEPPQRREPSPASLLFAGIRADYDRKQQEQQQTKASEEERRIREERERNRRIAEEEARQKALELKEAAEKAAREEAEKQRLHRLAEAARLRRREQEEAQREAERNWLNGIRKGPEGVRHYVDVLLQRTTTSTSTSTNTITNTNTTPLESSDAARSTIDPDRIVALRSLCIVFEQIQKNPEEVNKRKIKRGNPNFERDIGRHDGGIELLIAAGFRPKLLPATTDGDTIADPDNNNNNNNNNANNNGITANDDDEVPEIAFLISKEPNLEHDMDGWMAWFDLNKATLEILQAELQKVDGTNKRSRR